MSIRSCFDSDTRLKVIPNRLTLNKASYLVIFKDYSAVNNDFIFLFGNKDDALAYQQRLIKDANWSDARINKTEMEVTLLKVESNIESEALKKERTHRFKR